MVLHRSAEIRQNEGVIQPFCKDTRIVDRMETDISDKPSLDDAQGIRRCST